MQSTINRLIDNSEVIDNMLCSSMTVALYMNWGGGVIGWQASSLEYVANDLSRQQSNSNAIACLELFIIYVRKPILHDTQQS